MNKDITPIDNIKELFGQIDKSDKKDFIDKVAEEFLVSPSTVSTGWFSRWWIPEKYMKKLIPFMQRYICLKKGIEVS